MQHLLSRLRPPHVHIIAESRAVAVKLPRESSNLSAYRLGRRSDQRPFHHAEPRRVETSGASHEARQEARKYLWHHPPTKHLCVFPGDRSSDPDVLPSLIADLCRDEPPLEVRRVGIRAFLNFGSVEGAKAAKEALTNARFDGIRSVWYCERRGARTPSVRTTRMFVGNIGQEITRDEFTHHMKQLGGVTGIEYIQSPKRSKGFVDFATVAHAAVAIQILSNTTLDTSSGLTPPLVCDYSIPRTVRPLHLGSPLLSSSLRHPPAPFLASPNSNRESKWNPPSDRLCVFAPHGTNVDEFAKLAAELCGDERPTNIRTAGNKAFLSFPSVEAATTAKYALMRARSHGKVRKVWFGKSKDPPKMDTRTSGIFVNNLGQEITIEEFTDAMRQLDGVAEVRYLQSENGLKGFVDFATPEQAIAAMEALDGTTLGTAAGSTPPLVCRPAQSRLDLDKALFYPPEPPNKSLYIKNLPTWYKHRQLTALFSSFKGFESVFIPAYHRPKLPWAVVHFDSVEAATKALEEAPGRALALKHLWIRFLKTR